MSRYTFLVGIAVATAGCGAEFEGSGDLSFRWAVEVAPPSGNCTIDHQNLQAALDAGATNVNIPPGTYCIFAPLYVRSGTVVTGAGSGDDPAMNTIIEQRNSATSAFHMNEIQASALRNVRVVLDGDISSPPAGEDCVRHPDDESTCLWRRGSGVAIYGSSDIEISGNTFMFGTYGVALLDQPNLQTPLAGPEAEVVGAAPDAEAWYDACTDLASNRRITITRNTIIGARDGIFVLNSIDGEISRNTVALSLKYNGLKFSCGPVENNEVVANYLYGNGIGGLGDGIDVAWGWSELPEPWGWTVEDPPDGYFRDNVFIGNLSWGNSGNGFEIKSSKYMDPTPKRGLTAYFCGSEDPLDLVDILRIGETTVALNAAWSNRLSQFVLRRSAPSAGCFVNLPWNERTQIVGNVWRADPTAPANGFSMGMVRNAHFERNWSEGSWGGGNARDYYFFHPSIHFVSGMRNFGDWSDVDQVEGVTYEGNDPDIVGFKQTLADPTLANYENNLAVVVASDPYHCEDDDGDGCANACEALASTDHKDPASTPTVCACPGDACS